MTIQMRKCCTCYKVKPETKFRMRNTKTASRSYRCRQCEADLRMHPKVVDPEPMPEPKGPRLFTSPSWFDLALWY